MEDSNERRDLERLEEVERIERIGRANKQMRATLERIDIKMKQQKITDTASKQKKIVEREEDRSKRILIEEAEKELWRKLQQKKGKGMKSWVTVGEKESLERKLEIIEGQVEKYRVKLERIKKREK